MTSRIEALAERRRSLVRRSAKRRADLAATVDLMRGEIAVAETIVDAVRRIRRYRAVFGIVAASFAIFGPGRTRRFISGALAIAPFAIEAYRFAKGTILAQPKDG
jgi:hypothetical protein